MTWLYSVDLCLHTGFVYHEAGEPPQVMPSPAATAAARGCLTASHCENGDALQLPTQATTSQIATQ